MTSLRLRPIRGFEVLLAGGLLVWTALVVALKLGLAGPPGGSDAVSAVTYAVPLGLAALALFYRGEQPALSLAAGAAFAVMLATVLPAEIARNPKIALAIPAAAIGGVVTQRFPTASLSLVFVLASTYGSIKAFTGVPGDSVMDKVIDGLWVGVLGRFLIGRRRIAVHPTPALFAIGAFLLAAALRAMTTTPLHDGIRAFRLAPLFLSLVLLVGYGGFTRRTLHVLARVMVVVSVLVAAYAALRWAIGPAAKEQALQRTTLDRQYNQLAFTDDAKVQGALPNGVLLGLWSACTLPLLVAAALAWRGLLRLVAAIGIPLTVIALLGSAQRAGLAAAAAGGLLVIVAHVLSRASRGPRLGIAIAAALFLLGCAAVVYPAVLNNPEKQKRYENLLAPRQDGPFQERLTKWQATLDAVKEEPLGHGLGQGDPQAVPHRFADIAYYEIDNSYLMIGYDQGIAAMILFALALLVVLIELLRHAIWTRGPSGAALSAAGAGTVVAMLAEFMANDFVYAPVVAAGWMIVGLGVAQYATGARSADQAGAPARRAA